jgi:hypothetical protein
VASSASFGLKLWPVMVSTWLDDRLTALQTVMLALDGSLDSGGADERQPLSGGGADDEVCPPPPPWCDEDDAPCAGVVELPCDAVCESGALALFEFDAEPWADPELPAIPVGAAFELPGSTFESTGPAPPLPPLHAATSKPVARAIAPARNAVDFAIPASAK